MSFIYSAFRFGRKLVAFIICLAVIGYSAFTLSLIYYPQCVDIVVFLNHVALPFTRNFSDLTHFGLDHVHATAHHVVTPDGVTLGAWLIEPPPNVKPRRQLILYHHGNSGTRGTPHRITLYKVLASSGFDVLTFDYRGYADSTCDSGNCQPTENGLITDATTIYKWAIADVGRRWNANGQSIVVWGHSLGGGAAANTVEALCPDSEKNCDAVRALILEATFNDVADAALKYPLAWAMNAYEPAQRALTNALKERHLAFNNTEALGKIRLPVLMLHAADDLIVPADLSYRAFLAADNIRPDDWPEIEYKLYDSQLGYGHRAIHDDPNLTELVRNFVDRSH